MSRGSRVGYSKSCHSLAPSPPYLPLAAYLFLHGLPGDFTLDFEERNDQRGRPEMIVPRSCGIFPLMRALVGLLAVVMTVSSGSRAAEEGASQWVYRAWQTEDGLPDNGVSGVAQAKGGFMWVATMGGLMRFNGRQFTTIPLGQFPGLRSRSVRAMHLDARDQLWLSMERGPVIRLGSGGQRVFSEGEGVPPNLVRRILGDGSGATWLLYQDRLVRIDGDEISSFDAEEGMPKGAFPSAATDAEGNLWVSAGRELVIHRNGRFESVPAPAAGTLLLGDSRSGGPWLMAGARLLRVKPGHGCGFEEVARLPKGAKPVCLLEEREGGALWIGTGHHGLMRVVDGRVERIPTSHLSIKGLCEDHEGNVWVGTTGAGLNMVRLRVAEMLVAPDQLPFAATVSLCEDTAGRLWLAGGDGGLAVESDGGWARPEGFDAHVTCLAPGAGGKLWAGTKYRGVWHFDGADWQRLGRDGGLPGWSVRSLLHAGNGDLWVATDAPSRLSRLRAGEWVAVPGPEGLGPIRALAEGPDGCIWAGTANGEILRVEDGRLVNQLAAERELPFLSVRDLHATGDGSLWVGFAGDGIGCLKDGGFHQFTTAHGLQDDYVSQLISDDRGGLWVAANRGLFRFKVEELLAVARGESTQVRCRAYAQGEALPSLQPSRNNSPSSWRRRDGRLCFAMLNGLVVVQPREVRDEPPKPQVAIEKVTLEGRAIARYAGDAYWPNSGGVKLPALAGPDVELEIPADHQQLAFHVAALSFSSPENVYFRYRLDGHDGDWIQTQDEALVKYPHLKAGNYEFRVAASNGSGTWTQAVARVRLRVHPYFWETWWFRVGGGVATVLLSAGFVFLVLRRRHRRQMDELHARQAIEQERARIARDIHDDLGATLTRITLLSKPQAEVISSPTASEQSFGLIHQSARQLVRSMGEVVWAVNPQHDSFDALATYLSDHAHEFLELAGVRCRLDMPLDLPSRNLSAQVRHNIFLAFKESLHNVVKHAGASEVRIRLMPGDDGFTLRVEDDGCGISEHADGGHGLANMRQRMQEIGGSCEISRSTDGGGRVVFMVPYRRPLHLRFAASPPTPSVPVIRDKSSSR